MSPSILTAVVAALVFSPGQAMVNGVPVADPKTSEVQNKVDALQMNQTMAYTRTLDASGNDVIDFAPSFTAPPRISYFPQNSDTTGKPIVCNYQTLTATRMTYHCDKSTGKIASLLNSMFDAAGAAGATIQVLVRGTLTAMP